MSLKVTSSKPRSYRERHITDGFNVYVDSNATKVIDDFFYANKIFALPFKSKAWTKLKASATKLDITEMKKAWPTAGQFAYSHTAGCSCGCSPGYKVRKNFSQIADNNHDVWCTIKTDISNLVESLPKFKKMLDAEIEANTNLITA